MTSMPVLCYPVSLYSQEKNRKLLQRSRVMLRITEQFSDALV